MDAIVAACTGWYSIFKSSSSMKNLETLLTISNIESANIIFFTISFRTGKFSLPVNLFVYFFLLSRWKRITKVILENMNPIITVKAEVVKKSDEYFVDTYATTRLTTNPTVPERSRFLLREIVLRYLR
jgi:hypothetical protein